MLKQINIENFAIVARMNINFESGLTVITGQTGAGKSIVIDAIEQILGGRASTSIIGPNSDSTFIEGIFDLNEEIIEILTRNNIAIEEDYLIISKKINADGKSQLRLNNRLVTNELVRQLASSLLEIHSQQSTYVITNQAKQQELIDSYFNDSENKLYQEYQNNYDKYHKLLNEQEELLTKTIDPELLDFYTDQLNEINEHNIKEEELKTLNEQENILKDFEKIYSSFETIMNYLESGNTLDQLNLASQEFEKISNLDKYDTLSNKLNELYYELVDLKDEIKKEFNSLSFNEQEFEEIKERLYNYNRMIKKYSYSQDEVQRKIADLNTKIDFIKNSDSLQEKIATEIKDIYDKLLSQGKELTTIRKKYISKLEKDILSQLDDLYLKDAKFVIDLEETKPIKYGLEKVNFLFNANKGTKLYSLNQVASGGELSRLMLAIKVVSITNNKMYIFDEIDTGVSGEVANAIGLKLKQLAKDNNIICITHLPQVAVYANNHLYIEKSSDKSFTTSNCYYLDDEEEIKEVAKMLSGDQISESALVHAKELKEAANNA